MSSKEPKTKVKADETHEEDTVDKRGSSRSGSEVRAGAKQAKPTSVTKSDTKWRGWDTNVETDVSSEDSKTDKAKASASETALRESEAKVSAAADADEDSVEQADPSRLAGVRAGVARARDWAGDKIRDIKARGASDVDDDTDADEPDEAVAGVEADDMRRFLDARRPWLRPITKRDRRRRLGGLYWTLVYVLLMAGATSLIGFLVVRGYLILWPGPTSSGTTVARQVVPWVFFVVFFAFAAYVTRSVGRTLGYALLFLLPYLVFLFVREATDLAVWLVGWVPGNTQVYGLAALGPFIAFVLLGRDFLRWQLWVEFPNDSCWECATIIGGESWAFCPTCGADLQEQRYAEAEDESAAVVEAIEDTKADSEDEIDITQKHDDGPFDLDAEESGPANRSRSASAAKR